jgi:hypothetical protein
MRLGSPELEFVAALALTRGASDRAIGLYSGRAASTLEASVRDYELWLAFGQDRSHPERLRPQELQSRFRNLLLQPAGHRSLLL